MKTVDVTFQNLDSSEISLTDVSHYFDSDPTKLVAGLRQDGRTPSAFIADTTTANAQVPSCASRNLAASAMHCIHPFQFKHCVLVLMRIAGTQMHAAILLLSWIALGISGPSTHLRYCYNYKGVFCFAFMRGISRQS